MQLITLNVWGGHVLNPLLTFIKSQQHIDIFCFQEVYHEAPNRISIEDRAVNLRLFSDLEKLLPDHQGFFRPVVDTIYGIAIFIRTSIKMLAEGEVTIHNNPTYIGKGPTHSRKLQWLQCEIDGRLYSIVNVHGLWNGKGKSDTPERVAQSQQIKKFIDTLPAPKILCGDFNLRPDTESMHMIEQGMKNLIKDYQITSTRTNLYSKDEKFADYILVSPDVNVKKFSVLENEISDHAPLFIEFV